jgi:hypothetical protein
MAKASQARRTNRLIALVAVLLLAGAGAIAATKPAPEGIPSDSTVAKGNGEPAPDLDYLSRPADTGLTWLYHSLSAEQFDYEMDELSCPAIRKYISADLCAVVSNDNGSFMLVGTEGFWDPQEPNSAGVVKIPLDLTVYALTDENGPTRAMSVMDGSVSVDYDGEPTALSAYSVATKDGGALVLHKRPQGDVTESYDFYDELQVLAVSPSGAPTVVAAYEGSGISVQGDGTGVVFASDRYASPSKSGVEPTWKTFTYLSPAEGQPYGWSETMRSGSRLRVAEKVKPVLVDEYEWPNSARRGSDA